MLHCWYMRQMYKIKEYNAGAASIVNASEVRDQYKVHYPRFVTQIGEQLEWQVNRENWLNSNERDNVQRFMKKYKGSPVATHIIHSSWWGVYDEMSAFLSDKITTSHCPKSLKSTRVGIVTHDYLWDEQAVSGRSMELVVLNSEMEVEHASMLVDQKPGEYLQFARPRNLKDRIFLTDYQDSLLNIMMTGLDKIQNENEKYMIDNRGDNL